jgi:hypothetical protein
LTKGKGQRAIGSKPHRLSVENHMVIKPFDGPIRRWGLLSNCNWQILLQQIWAYCLSNCG